MSALGRSLPRLSPRYPDTVPPIGPEVLLGMQLLYGYSHLGMRAGPGVNEACKRSPDEAGPPNCPYGHGPRGIHHPDCRNAARSCPTRGRRRGSLLPMTMDAAPE